VTATLLALPRATRQNSRRRPLLDAAAALFRKAGYPGTSIRDISAAAAMTPGAVYSHFPSKAELLVAVYAEGVARIAERVDDATQRERDPAKRLAAACEAHLSALLDGSDHAQVLVRVLPRDVPEAAEELDRLRESYEARFRLLIDDLDLDGETKRSLRLLLLGALNWAQVWYRPGRKSPKALAKRFLSLINVLPATVT